MTRRRRSLAFGLAAAAATVVITLALAEPAAACTVCFGDPESAETRGLRGAILFLLVLVGLVQVGFVRLFWEFRRRAKLLDDRKKQLRIVRGGVRS
ncbi:MAG TPA: hypothetical protein VMS86_05415 [Thermoanaerobaculia bacterium]|nr:hypothetical protein [Thermoanaerobaculia bacterium]